MLISEIQRGCVHDGPGVRTTIFFKGCPLHCPWCSNPETQKKEKENIYFEDNCLGPKCRNCLSKVLPQGELKDLSRTIFQELQFLECPYGAIRQVGQEISPENLVKELSWEYPFLRAGVGGITFSGGEPLLQGKELYRLATLLKKDGINLAIESSFYFFDDFEYIKNTLSQIDHIFIDIKILEESMAQEILGETSKFFKRNISLYYPMLTKKLVYRFILVPGFTDSVVNLETVCAFIQQFPPIELQVMPVHNLGAYKYQRLGRDFASFDSPEAGDLRKTAAFFRPHVNGRVSILEF